jgi:hypothetical protein
MLAPSRPGTVHRASDQLAARPRSRRVPQRLKRWALDTSSPYKRRSRDPCRPTGFLGMS